jgi:hypothetical protein
MHAWLQHHFIQRDKKFKFQSLSSSSSSKTLVTGCGRVGHPVGGAGMT